MMNRALLGAILCTAVFGVQVASADPPATFPTFDSPDYVAILLNIAIGAAQLPLGPGTGSGPVAPPAVTQGGDSIDLNQPFPVDPVLSPYELPIQPGYGIQ